MRMNARISSIQYRYTEPVGVLRVCEEISSYSEPETTTDWQRAHERIVALGRERAGHERLVCRWLLCAERLGVFARCGYASLREYAERMLGISARQTEERLRVGRALAHLPELDGALASGKLSWSAVRELTRIATADTESDWVNWAERRRANEVERAVAEHIVGDGPDATGDPARLKHRLSFEVQAETMALFRDLQAKVRADIGHGMDDDTLLFEIARRALGGPDDVGRASYQVAVSRCEACGRTSIDAAGHSEVVDDAVAEMAQCDSQHVGDVASPHVGATRATQTIPPAIRRQVMRRDHMRCMVPGCRNHQFLDVHHLDPRSEGGGHDPERLAVLCGSHHRAVHQGRLWLDGTGSTGFVVRHAGGASYGSAPNAPKVEVVAQVQSALEQLGFKPTKARSLIEAGLGAGAHDPTSLLHEALRLS
jgi:hypothetical protein